MIGCVYQVIQVTVIYFKFETKIDVSFDLESPPVIPMVSFCKETINSLRNSSDKIQDLSPAQIDNKTFSFAQVFIYVKFMKTNFLTLMISHFKFGNIHPKKIP